MSAVEYVTGGVDTRTLPPGQRAACWRDHVTDNHGRLHFTFADAARFLGGTRVQRTGDVQLVDFWSEPIAYERRDGCVDRDGDDGLRILVPSSGTIAVHGPEDGHRLGPGTAAVVSMTHGFRLEQDQRARALILSVPSRLWPGVVPRNPVVVDARRGVGAVFAAMLREMSTQGGDLDAPSLVTSVETAVALVARGASSMDGDLLAQARAVAREHSDDPAFDPHALAERLGWSLRSVQLALQHAGSSPADLIRDLRVRRVAARLTHPDWATQTISAIAHASGFGSLSAFNAAFRARYDRVPAEFRRDGRRE